jgi:hypothetical protein
MFPVEIAVLSSLLKWIKLENNSQGIQVMML